MTPATIKAIRQALGLSGDALGARLGVSGRTIRYWESGAERPHPATAERLLGLEAAQRGMVEAAIREIEAADAAAAELGASQPVIALIRYREAGDMLPGTAPPAIGMHHAAIAALRLRYGPRVLVVDWMPDNYRAWRGDRPDTQSNRAAWAANIASGEPP